MHRQRARGLFIVVLFTLATSILLRATGGNDLVLAVRNQDRAAIKTLLAKGADVNARQPDGATALHWSAYQNDLETTRLLVRAGADVNARDDLGITALLLAAKNGNTELGQALLAANAQPGVATIGNGETPLMAAARTGTLSLVLALLSHGADVNASETSHGQTALMWAAASGHPDVVRALLDAGAKVTARTSVRRRLVYVGKRNAGADKAETDRNQVDMPEGGNTPLIFAARSGDPESATLLLAKGASANEAGADGRSALLMATLSGNSAVATALLEKGSDPNAAGVGYTPLIAAILRGDTELVRTLLRHGADPNAPLTRGMPVRRRSHDFAVSSEFVGITPFLLAAKFLEVDMMRALAAAGADTRARFGDGTNALMFAAGIGSGTDRRELEYLAESLNAGRPYDRGLEEEHTLAAVLLAVELGGDVNASTVTGESALHAAASRAYVRVAEYLVARGASLEARNAGGHTPLAVALGAGRRFSTSAAAAGPRGNATAEEPIVEFLRRNGAK